MSTSFFGSQPLTTRQSGTPDSLAFGLTSPGPEFEDVLRERLPDDSLLIIVEPAVRLECVRSVCTNAKLCAPTAAHRHACRVGCVLLGPRCELRLHKRLQ